MWSSSLAPWKGNRQYGSSHTLGNVVDIDAIQADSETHRFCFLAGAISRIDPISEKNQENRITICQSSAAVELSANDLVLLTFIFFIKSSNIIQKAFCDVFKDVHRINKAQIK